MTLATLLTADQRRAVENVRAAAARIWARPLHRYFTDHGPAHARRIEALLDGLTAGMMATHKRLAPTEAFVLLAAACLHDIGMQDERFANGDLEEIRKQHHLLTAELIFQASEDPAKAVRLGLPDDPGLVEAIALIARGHRKESLAVEEYNALSQGGEMLRLRLLAALLRFADELDIDYRRVDLEQMKLLNLPVESQLHWWKCHYVGGVSIVDEYIRVAYRFPQARPDYEQLIIPLIENEIRAKHAALEPIFRVQAVKVAIGPPEVRLMRLVKPLPEEVEALARAQIQGDAAAAKPPTEGEKSPRKRRAAATKPASEAVFDQRGQHVGTQINVAGDYHASSEVTSSASTPAVLRRRLQRLDSVELETLCLDYFPVVYDKFARGLQRGEMINLLLAHCRRNPEDGARLAQLLS